MKPPLLARVLLLAMAGEQEYDFVAGDLHEEFLYLCAARGRGAGRRWYFSQVLRSALPLSALRMRKGEIAHAGAAAGLGVALPLLLLDRLWSFVYSAIPLKDGLGRSFELLAANLVCACVMAGLCGATAASYRRALGIAASTAAAAAFALIFSAGAAAPTYRLLLIAAVPASAVAGFRARHALTRRRCL